MAYMTAEGDGPYACDAGEYCDNHRLGSEPVCRSGQTPDEARAHQQAYLAGMRFGRPRGTGRYSGRELAAMGMVGLYLRESRSLRPGERHVPTPPELREPSAETETTESMEGAEARE